MLVINKKIKFIELVIQIKIFKLAFLTPLLQAKNSEIPEA